MLHALMSSQNEMAYPAELAGLSYALHNSQAGFQVCVDALRVCRTNVLGVQPYVEC